MLDRMGWRALAAATALAALQLGAAARAQTGVLTGTDDPTCRELTVACGDLLPVECPAGETCQLFGRDLNRCAPSPALFCCESDADCPTDTSGPGGEWRCAEVAGAPGGICLRDHTYCAPPGSRPSLRTILACHSVAGSSARQRYEDGDCDRDGIPNADDPAPCLPPHIGVWAPGTGRPVCLSGEAAQLQCDEVGDDCTLADGRTAVCTANARTGGQRVCSTLPDLFCCGGLLHVDCPAGECVLPSGKDDGQGMCTRPELICYDSPTWEQLLACHTFRGVLTTIENGDCDGDEIRNADESDDRRCVPDARPDAGPVTRDGGANIPSDAGGSRRDAGSMGGDGGGVVAPFDAAGTPIDPRFNGGGGCACRSAPAGSTPHGGWLALAALGLVALRRRSRSGAPR